MATFFSIVFWTLIVVLVAHIVVSFFQPLTVVIGAIGALTGVAAGAVTGLFAGLLIFGTGGIGLAALGTAIGLSGAGVSCVGGGIVGYIASTFATGTVTLNPIHIAFGVTEILLVTLMGILKFLSWMFS